MGGRSFSYSSAWARNEAMARQMEQDETKYVGAEGASKRRLSAGRHAVEWTEDSALGLDGVEFRMGDERMTHLKEEREVGGTRFRVYWQAEGGGTYMTTHEKVDQGGRTGHRQIDRPRRIFGF